MLKQKRLVLFILMALITVLFVFLLSYAVRGERKLPSSGTRFVLVETAEMPECVGAYLQLDTEHCAREN